jgi:hypothetical protein
MKNKIDFKKISVCLIIIGFVFSIFLFNLKLVSAATLYDLRPSWYIYWRDKINPINLPLKNSLQNMSQFNDSSLNLETRIIKNIANDLVINTPGRIFAYSICLSGSCRIDLPAPKVNIQLCPKEMEAVYSGDYLFGCKEII